MALIKCPECKKKISDQCDSCPNCGYPLKENPKKQVSEETNNERFELVILSSKSFYKNVWLWIVVAVVLHSLVLGIFWFFYQDKHPMFDDESNKIVNNVSNTDVSYGKDVHIKSEGVMTYSEYVAAALESEVVIEAFVQGKQSWWDNEGTFYLQDKDGGYFVYEMDCTEEEYNKLTIGTKIKVTGYKSEWSGEVEIIDAKFEILEGTYVAEPTDVTALLGKDELIEKQNMLVSFSALTIEKIEYKNGEPGDDIYVTVSKDGKNYDFCVEYYLTGPKTAVYKAFADLKAGDVVDIEGFLYWYNAVNTHIVKVEKK